MSLQIYFLKVILSRTETSDLNSPIAERTRRFYPSPRLILNRDFKKTLLICLAMF